MNQEVTKVKKGMMMLVRRICPSLVTAACAAALFMLPAPSARAQATGGGSGQGSAAQQSQPAAQPAGQSTAQAAKPNLAGTWKLNQDQSDDPRAKMREAMGNSGGGSEQGGSEQGGGGMGGGRGMRRPGRGPGGGGGMMAEWQQLTIEQTDAGVKVNGATGRLLATTEKQAQSTDDNSGGMGRSFPPAEAQWQGSQLIATSHGFGGGTTTRTFELSPDGKQLIVTSKIENQRFNQPVTYKQVYDPGKADSGSSSQ
ncbi:MAG TPA: hypothetical protein VMH00_05840 [Candidatus Limnocylindrales bacterium]|nr:hypothetical protein [Candidatus Limnocylindrales bacterium]